MECDHNEMGGAEMSLRSKLAVLGLTATLAPFGAQAGESVTYTVDGADYEATARPPKAAPRGWSSSSTTGTASPGTRKSVPRCWPSSATMPLPSTSSARATDRPRWPPASGDRQADRKSVG